MQSTKKIFTLKGRSQHYNWGGTSFIPRLLQVSNEKNQPYAEYWMGAHDKAPSTVVDEGKETGLDKIIAADVNGTLGANVAAKFGRLPYLFKVLDVKDMLSIQVHPSKESAVEEFEKENRKGVALNAANRNYKDDNHKPELMFALSEFWLLHGFKEEKKLVAILKKVPELQFLLPVFEKESYEGLYKKVMEMDQHEVNERLQPLLDRIIPLYKEEKLHREDEDFWAARAAITFNETDKIDRGIFSIYLFNVVKLMAGEAIFQDAGVPHAYLEGQNIEIMANSDNVLRGGLTNKHIDVPELLKHTRPEATIPKVIRGQKSGIEGEEVFLTPAADFELRKIDLQPKAQTVVPVKTTDIFFVYKGEVAVTEGDDRINAKAGDSFLVLNGGKPEIKASTIAQIFRATVPGADK